MTSFSRHRLFVVIVFALIWLQDVKADIEATTILSTTDAEDTEGCSIDGNCFIVCCNIQKDQAPVIPDLIYDLTTNGSCQEFRVLFHKIQLVDNILPKHWLPNGNKFYILGFANTEIEQVEDSAFSRDCFPNLQRLEIIDSQIRNVTKKYFTDSTIKSLSLGYNEFTSVDFTEAFDDLASSLEVLKILKSIKSSESLNMLTGPQAKQLPLLVNFDITGSKLTALFDDIFAALPAAEDMNLTSCEIQFIYVKAFFNNKNLKLLNLSNNLLTTLPAGLFDFFPLTAVMLDGNNWTCNCSLKWLQSMFLTNPHMFGDGFLCDGVTPVDQVQFCADEFLISIECVPYRNVTVAGDKTLLKETALRKGGVKIRFEQIDHSSNIFVTVFGNLASDILLWVETPTPRKVNCYDQLEDNPEHRPGGVLYFIFYLNYDRTYTFCLLKGGHTEISPTDCTSLKVPSQYEEQTWISNKSRPLALGGLIACCLITVIITATSAYFLIKHHPKLIKGNKRVIIIEKKLLTVLSNERIVRPPLNYLAYSNVSYGYTAPKIYEQIDEAKVWTVDMGVGCVTTRKACKRRSMAKLQPSLLSLPSAEL